jgi:hypothetical protein
MVAWTADVDDSEFCDGSLDLKHTDADIAKLLQACGGKRGWEYTWEFQILNILVTGFFPVIILESPLGLSVFWISKFLWEVAKSTADSCSEKPFLWLPIFAVETFIGPGGVLLWFLLLRFSVSQNSRRAQFFAWLVPVLLWSFLVIYSSASCANEVYILVEGIMLTEFVWIPFCACFVFAWIFYFLFILPRVKRRTSYLAVKFHGNCRSQKLFGLLRSGIFSSVIWYNAFDTFESFAGRTRRGTKSFFSGRNRLRDSDNSYWYVQSLESGRLSLIEI